MPNVICASLSLTLGVSLLSAVILYLYYLSPTIPGWTQCLDGSQMAVSHEVSEPFDCYMYKAKVANMGDVMKNWYRLNLKSGVYKAGICFQVTSGNVTLLEGCKHYHQICLLGPSTEVTERKGMHYFLVYRALVRYDAKCEVTGGWYDGRGCAWTNKHQRCHYHWISSYVYRICYKNVGLTHRRYAERECHVTGSYLVDESQARFFYPAFASHEIDLWYKGNKMEVLSLHGENSEAKITLCVRKMVFDEIVSSKCPMGWYLVHDYCFVDFDGPMTYIEAQSLCSRHNAHLIPQEYALYWHETVSDVWYDGEGKTTGYKNTLCRKNATLSS